MWDASASCHCCRVVAGKLQHKATPPQSLVCMQVALTLGGFVSLLARVSPLFVLI